MSVKKYKFVSPGVFLSEIDNSQVPEEPSDIGPVIIGRTVRGPAMRPVQVNSFSEFVTIFGNASEESTESDAWRRGFDGGAPLYAVYGAQAWLRNNSPLTFVRLLGNESSNKTSAGSAGWFTRNTTVGGDYSQTFHGNAAEGGGAYGLFIVPSSSMQHGVNAVTGALAAVWYFNNGSIALSGAVPGVLNSKMPGDGGSVYAGVTPTASAGMWISSQGASKTFTAALYASGAIGDGAISEKITFSLDRTSNNYIRKVFNSDPRLTNARITTNTKNYFLGETFDRHAYESFITGSNQGYGGRGSLVQQVGTAVDTYGVILPLKLNTGATERADNRKVSQAAQTGWFFAQDFESLAAKDMNATVENTFEARNMQKLFKFVALDDGRWASANIKISIANIQASLVSSNLYGTFSVIIRKISDTDGAIQVIERFDNLDLNADSPNYIARRIGDTYQTWDATNLRYTEYGDFENQSKFIRVSMDSDVSNKSQNEECLPFGVYGPPRWRSFHVSSGSVSYAIGDNKQGAVGATTLGLSWASASFAQAAVPTVWGSRPTATGSVSYPGANNAPAAAGAASFAPHDVALAFPQIYLRVSSSLGNNQSPGDAFWGANTTLGGLGESIYDRSTPDVLRQLPAGIDDFGTVSTTGTTEYSWIFTLDNVTQNEGLPAEVADIQPDALYRSGSRQQGFSITAMTGNYNSVLTSGFDQFTTVMHGGGDGLDIYEKEPFNNTFALASTQTDMSSYAHYSVRKAINSVKDPEVVEYNLAAIPGITNDTLNDYMVAVCEDRADSLAVVDLPGVYVPAWDAGTGGATRASVTTVAAALKTRGLDSSYACTYFPWVRIHDTTSDVSLWAPPSIAAIGTFSSSEKASKLWFAPAGFNRGGLSEGSAGIPVTGVRDKLTSKERDKLYEASINPIASFPAEGIVIFGQKTLQLNRSALDRINVRRLMIYVKKQISRIASTILFDQNVPATWDRFLAQVNPFLSGIQSDFGLTDFKVVLDETTTTPELVDRNILYAKIFLKPARAIEYIAIDFNITRSGASFED